MGESRKKMGIGDWTFTPAENLLQKGRNSIGIEPRAADLLIYLANHAGEVISADELIDSVWQGRVVGEGAVYKSINQLRHALGDDRDNVRYIQTIPKRGYRLVAPVVTLEPPPSKRRGSAIFVGQVSGRNLGFAIAGILALTLAVLAVYYVEEPRGLLPNSVAVLPFENLSPDTDNAYFAAGIHEEVLNQLVKLQNLSVISRTSVVRFAESNLSIPEIAKELNVETVMDGSVRYAGDRVRISVQLIDGETGEHLWSEVYEREFSGVFAIQADIAKNIANSLEVELSLVEQESMEKVPTNSPAAYRLYLAALGPSGGLADVLLDRAIELDPEFALAYAEKALLSTAQLVGVGDGASPDEALELERVVQESAEHALRLDPTLGAAHAALGVVHQSHWRGDAAEEAFQRANEFSPNDVQVLIMYGRFKRYRGEYDEAIALKRRAVELAPDDAFPLIQLALTYRFAGDWDAVATANRNLADSRGFADYEGLAMAEAARGNINEALRALRLGERSEEARPPYVLSQAAHGYAFSGRSEEANRLFAEIVQAAEDQPIGEAIWARAYIAVGNYDEALHHVELAVVNRVPTDFAALAELAANPWNDPELASPPFRALLDELWDDG